MCVVWDYAGWAPSEATTWLVLVIYLTLLGPVTDTVSVAERSRELPTVKRAETRGERRRRHYWTGRAPTLSGDEADDDVEDPSSDPVSSDSDCSGVWSGPAQRRCGHASRAVSTKAAAGRPSCLLFARRTVS